MMVLQYHQTKAQMQIHPCSIYVQILRSDFPECDSIKQHLKVRECPSCETRLKESFFAILGDVLDLDYIFGGMRGKQFLPTVASIFPTV